MVYCRFPGSGEEVAKRVGEGGQMGSDFFIGFFLTEGMCMLFNVS